MFLSHYKFIHCITHCRLTYFSIYIYTHRFVQKEVNYSIIYNFNRL